MIPVYQPNLTGNEKAYVNDCLDSTWISSKGKYIERFEKGFGDYVGGGDAVAVCNGTVAMHLALLALGIAPGDEVIVPTLTYIASVNPIVYVGATPVFVDSVRASWQIDPVEIRKRITPRTRAIIVVHLYGHPADMPAIMEIAREHDLLVIEDCAEAIGSRIGGQHIGTFGDIAAFSFFGNKTITTGEGGMVVTRNQTLLDRTIRLKGQGLAKHRIYWHDIVGYNFRMTNVCAAIGCAQLERIDETVARKQALAKKYDHLFEGIPVETHKTIGSDLVHSYWMYSILVPDGRRDEVMDELKAAGVETRPVFYPVHTMPMYDSRFRSYRTAEEIARRGINLPSWPDLKDEQVEFIVRCVAESLS